MSLLLTKVMATLVMLVVASTPGATVVTNSTFYEQIFDAPTQVEFENALGFFFSESLSSLNYMYTYLLMPASQPTTNITLKAGDYLESKYISTELVTRLDIYLRVIGTVGTSFHILFTQGSTILLDEDRSAVATMWYHFNLPTPYRSGIFTLRITLAGDTIRGGVFLTDSGAFTSTGATVANTSTYSHTYYDPEWQAYRGITETISDVISVNLEKTTTNGWIYTYSKETSTLYTLYRNIYTDNMITSTLLGYLDYPSMLTYPSLLEGGINYEFPTDLRVFLQDAINKEQNINLPYDRESFFQSLITVANNPSNASSTDWETVTTDSELLLAPLLPAPDNYQIDKRMINGEPVPVLTRKQTNIVETCVASHVKRVRMENEYGGLIWVYITVCDEYGTIDVSSYTDIARITSSTQYSSVPDDLLLLALQVEGERPSTPYFWDWVLEGYENNGHTVDQELKAQLAEAHPLSPITKTNVSLIINPKAPKGVSPYIAEIFITDANDNQILGNMSVTIRNINNEMLDTGVVVNGYTNFTLDDYEESITASVAPNEFFLGSEGTGNVKYDLKSLLQTQGAPGTDPINNHKLRMFNSYVRGSEAFDYDENTQTYQMITDMSHKWVDDPWPYLKVTRGYEIMSPVRIADEELKSGYFDDTTVTVRRYYGVGFPVEQRSEDFVMRKDSFLTMWLSMKVRGWIIGGNPPKPDELTEINTLAQNVHEVMLSDKTWLQQNTVIAKQKYAEIQAYTSLAVDNGFRKPVGLAEEIERFFNNLIEDFVAVIELVFDVILFTAFLTLVLWDTLLGGSLGFTKEIIKFITLKMLADVEHNVLVAITPFYNPDPNIDPFELGSNFISGYLTVWPIITTNINGILFSMLEIALLISSLMSLFMILLENTLNDRTAKFNTKIEGDYENPVFSTRGYYGRTSFFRNDQIEASLPSILYVLGYLLKTLTVDINKFLFEELILKGRDDSGDIGVIGEIFAIHYLTQRARFNILDLIPYDVIFFRTPGYKGFTRAPDFLIHGLTYFEAKGTGNSKYVNGQLDRAYTDKIKHALFEMPKSYSFTMFGLSSYYGISCFDASVRLLIVQWLRV